jgi:Holliday junction resolvase RusA-like endonuclease
VAQGKGDIEMKKSSVPTEYLIIPVAKPRMTRADKWEKRTCVMKYRDFCDDVRDSGLTLPPAGYHIVFILPMPRSWRPKKKKSMDGQPHQQTPDKDNLEKALLDALFQNDAHIWDGRVTKLWGYSGKIIVWKNNAGADEAWKVILEYLCLTESKD